MSWYCWQGGDLLLTVHLQPKAADNRFAGLYGSEAIKIRITAPPLEGRANRHLASFLAEVFGVAPSAVTLLSGTHHRHKRLKIEAPRQIPIDLGITPPPNG